MPTLDEVRQQIANYPDPYIFWTNKEIRMLPKVLDGKERIVALTSGLMESKTWLAVCTERRLIFINCNMFIGLQQVQMPLDRIQSLDHEFTLFFGSIRVYDGINSFTLRMVRKSAIPPFVKAIEEAMFAFRRATQSTGTAFAGTPDVTTQLARLAELREKGHLTEEEFQTQKRKLLG